MPVQTFSTKSRLIPSTRFTLALLLSFVLFVQYVQRISLSMGIVCMVSKTSINIPSNSTSYSQQFLYTTSTKNASGRVAYIKRCLQKKTVNE